MHQLQWKQNQVPRVQISSSAVQQAEAWLFSPQVCTSVVPGCKELSEIHALLCC